MSLAGGGPGGDESRPVMEEAVLREAERRCVADAARERSTCGVLPPCRSIDPLHPPLSQDEYEMMERDTAK